MVSEEKSMASSAETGLAMVIMGTSGSGKSTIGHLLANSLGCAFLDADDFHSAENKEKMRQEIPLTDADRLPWLETIRDTLIDYILRGKMVVLACSALKPLYRHILRTADFEYVLEMQENDQGNSNQGSDEIVCQKTRGQSTQDVPEEASSRLSKENGCVETSANMLRSPHRVRFFFLNGPTEMFASRLEHRFNEGAHFMPPSLLQSQMDSLQIGDNEKDVIFLDASMSPEAIVNQIKELVCRKA